MQPRNSDKPFMYPGTYHVMWFNEKLKHYTTITSYLNKIDLKRVCEKELLALPEGYSFVIIMPVHNSLITPWTPKGHNHEHI